MRASNQLKLVLNSGKPKRVMGLYVHQIGLRIVLKQLIHRVAECGNPFEIKAKVTLMVQLNCMKQKPEFP